jgi:CRP-like cAMP-binding protein
MLFNTASLDLDQVDPWMGLSPHPEYGLSKGHTNMPTSPLTLLQQQGFVKDFRPQQIEKLASIATAIRLPRDHILFREGDDCMQFYVIVSGLVALEMMATNRAFRIDTLGAGDEFGWSSVLMDRGKLFQARTLEDVELLMFEGPDLRAMCEDDTDFGYRLMLRLLGTVSERLQATRVQVLDMYWPDAKRAGA